MTSISTVNSILALGFNKGSTNTIPLRIKSAFYFSYSPKALPGLIDIVQF